MRPTAAKAALRPFQMTARSASSCATRISVEPFRRQMSSTDAHVLGHLLGDPVELGDQDRARTLRVAGVHRGLRGLDGQAIHHLDRGREDACRDDVRHRAAGLVGRGEGRHERGDLLGAPDDAQRDAHGDAHRPLRPDEHAEQVGARLVEALAAELDQLAVREHDREAAHVVDGEAVLEAVGAARVLGDVAADRAHLLARGIGRVVVAVRGDGLRHVEVGDTGLDDHAAAIEVDLEDAAHARDRDHDAAGDGQRTAREPRARAARDERHALRHGRRAPRPAPPRRSRAGRRARGSRDGP